MSAVSPAQISRFEPFTGLNRDLLLALCRQARMVDVPAGRWLLRPGRLLGGSHFLFQGSLRMVDPDRIIHSGGTFARRSVHPGAAGLKTLTDCRLLRLTDDAMSLLQADDRAELPVVVPDDDCWQLHFLRSHLMTTLPQTLWQRVLSRLVPLAVEADELIICEGSSADRDACYIMGSIGRAVVTVRGKQVYQIGAGDLFGEDALISSRPRNASVRITEAGVVMRLEAGFFQEFLAEVLASGAFEEPDQVNFSNARRQVFGVSSVKGLRERIACLDESVTYLVDSQGKSGDGDEDSKLIALALFLLRKRGLKAWAQS